MFSNNTNSQQGYRQSNPAGLFYKRFSVLWLLLAFAAVIQFNSSSAVLAQEKAGKPSSSMAAQLGLKAQDLVVKANSTFRDNPVTEDLEGDDLGASQKRLAPASPQSTSGVSDIVGTLSVQDFQGTQNTLYNTHASADGFRNYFTTWYTPNFAYRDAGVQVWAYNDVAFGDNFDLWNSGGTDYGIDAVRTCWHSGHGGMWSTNVFFAPMGGNWAGRGWNAFSNQMFLGGNNYSFGDERLRYMFWDTCNSVMVSGGNDPYSTWGVRSKGVRMVFGYETTSIDDSRYGSFFWEEWNKGKTLSQAFLDASWRISTGQSPAVVAFGSDQTEAVNRLNNERFLDWAPVNNYWGQWRWYFARSAMGPAMLDSSSLDTQGQSMVRKAVKKSNTNDEVIEVARALGIDLDDASLIQDRPFGLRAVQTQGATLLLEKSGNFELIMTAAEPQDTGGAELADDELINRAREIAGQLSLINGQEFRVGSIRDLNENGGSEGFQNTPRVVEKTVVFDQMIGGLPFIDPEAGHLEITFDARTGQTKRVRGTSQTVEISSQGNVGQETRLSLDQAREAAIKSFQGAGGQKSAQKLEVVSGTEAVGYHLIRGKAVPVYRAELKNPNEKFGRPQLAIIPLVKGY